MNSRLSPMMRRQLRKCGAALVIILAFVVLLTILVLAFFSRTIIERQVSNASANQTKVDLLARSAVDVIVGDLRQEIKIGSTNVITNGVSLYFPLTVTNMLPARSGNPAFTGPATNDPIPNLIRRSLRSDPLSSSLVGTSASAVSSTNASVNGRYVSPARWNSHYLIPRANAGSAAIDTTPTNSFVAPDWVMVTTNGPAVISAPDSSVIGRFAYAIYDEGGLLDANVAGYPSAMAAYPSAGTNSVIATKGSLAFADLSVIGITNVDNLVGWRNFATAKPSGSLGSYNFNAASLESYLAYVTNATNTGFLNVATNVNGGRTDQMFTSRQALLRFRRAVGFPQDSLQYLGTFSRDLEQPSFWPDPRRPKNTGSQPRTDLDKSTTADLIGWGGNDTYDPTGAKQDEINPALLTVRGADGAPLLKRRFPLNRLGLFSNPTGNAVEIKKFFGLTWDAANSRWNYTSPVGNAALSGIKTFSEVAAANRAPDFFEVLKAAISCDSLGKQHGGNNGQGAPDRFTKNDAAIDSYIDLQIIQIGANLIDQYDADSYPTAIRTGNGTSSGGNFYPPARTTSGVENLPYLYGWMSAWYRTRLLTAIDILPGSQPPGGRFPYETATLLQPIIWNPHALDTRSSPPDLPTQFRVIAGGVKSASVPVFVYPLVCSTISSGSAAAWWPDFDPNTGSAPLFPQNNPGGQDMPFPEAAVGPSVSQITFNTTPTGQASFREPYRIQSPNYPPGSGATATPQGTIATINSLELNEDGNASATAIGFFTGRCWTGPSVADNETSSYLNMGSISEALRLELQYMNSSGEYITYDTIDYAYCTSSLGSVNNLSIVDNDDAVSSNRGMKTGVRADPRSNRWGLPTMKVSPRWDNRVSVPTAANAVPLDLNQVYNSPSNTARRYPIYKWPQGNTLGPIGASSTGLFYRAFGDNQGGRPKSSGWVTTGANAVPQNFSDLSVNQPYVPGVSNPTTTYMPGGKSIYTDPDGVLRRASGAYYISNEGLALKTDNLSSRPVILNRPFRSVGEMGYAFRGVAWRDIDFWTPESGDAALLDVFCINEVDDADNGAVVSGRLNLNTRQPKVLAALIRGVSKWEGGVVNSVDEANAAANALVNWTGDKTNQIGGVLSRGPLRNRSELVGRFVSTNTNTAILNTTSVTVGGNGMNRADVLNINGAVAFAGFSSVLGTNVFAVPSDAAIKRRRESVIRALADSGNARTWNLLIDVVAQTGRYPQTGTDLAKFSVEGEARYWVHVAIDRFTGDVVAMQVEGVSE